MDDKSVSEREDVERLDGPTLQGYIYRCGKSRELVIVCHGFIEHRDKYLPSTLSEILCKKGFSVYKFDFRGNGGSAGKFEDSNYTNETDDLRSVIDHFSEQGYEIRSVFGHSMGGSVAILRAAADMRIKSLVLFSPRIFPLNHSVVTQSGTTVDELISLSELAPIPYWPKPNEALYKKAVDERRAHMQLMREGKLNCLPEMRYECPPYPISQGYFKDIQRVHEHVIRHIKQLRIPVFFIHGKKDEIVDPCESEQAYAAYREARGPNSNALFWDDDEVEHHLRGPIPTEEYISQIVDCWQQMLKRSEELEKSGQ